MGRVAALALCLFVAAQSTAVAGTRMVCRYTGKAMKNCCPQPGEQPVVEKPGCCQMLRSDAAPVAASSRDSLVERAVELAVVPPFDRGEVQLPVLRAEKSDEPLPFRLKFLSLRHLLL